LLSFAHNQHLMMKKYFHRERGAQRHKYFKHNFNAYSLSRASLLRFDSFEGIHSSQLLQSC
jgi:hypothetical protein